MNDASVRAMMAELADETPAATSVDPHRAAAAATRRRRRRQQLVIAGAAAITILVVIAATVLATVVRKPAPTVTDQPTSAPTSFDPAKTRLTTGWLPAGLDLWRREITRNEEQLDVGAGSDLTNVTIHLLAKDAFADTRPILTADRHIGSPVTGPEIHGKPSKWTPITATGKAGSEAGQLSWEWAPGATATVYVNGLPGAEAIAQRIATNLSFTERKLKLPFAIKAPVGSPMTHSLIDHSYPESYKVSLKYRSSPDDGPGVDVNVPPVNGGNYPSANERIGDYPAWVDGKSVTLYDTSADLLMEIIGVPANSGAGASTQAAQALARRVAASFVWVGDLKTPTTWS